MKNKLIALKERIKANYHKNKKFFIIVLIAWILCVSLTLISNSSTLGKKSYGNEYSQNVVEIDCDTVIEEIVPIYEGSQSVGIKIATYARNNSGNLNIRVIGADSNTEYANKTVNVKTLQDNAYYSFSLSDVLNENNDKNIRIIITSDSTAGSGVGIYYSANKYFENSSFTINGLEQNGDMTVRYLFENDIFKSFSNKIIVSTVTLITLLILMFILIEPKYEILFPSIILFLGLIFMIIITPLSVPDEQAHYESSLQLSNIVLGNDNYREIDSAYVSYSHYYGHYNVSAAYTRITEHLGEKLELWNKTTQMNSDVKSSYFVYFIPQAIGVTLARLFNVNTLKVFYAGRLFNLLFYCVCVYLAIKKTPVNKLLIGIIACLPLFIQTASSYSYDCFINGLCILSLGILSKWLYVDEKIKIKDYILAFLVCLGLAPAKYVYAFFAFLFFLVPSTRYGSKVKKIIGSLLLCAPGIYLLWPILMPRFKELFNSLYVVASNIIYADEGGKAIEIANQPIGTNPYTLEYALSNLSETIHLVLFTIRYNIKLWFYGAIGRYLSGQTIILPLSITYTIIAILILSALRKEDYVPKWYTRLSYIAVCILMGLLTVGGMLLYWTNIGDYYIQGVQGRYFCPLIPYFFSIFNNKKINVTKKIDKYLIIIYLFIMFEVIIYVLSYTFVN